MLDMLSGETRIFVIIGHPIVQVKSPAGITRAFVERGINAALIPIHVLPEDVDGFISYSLSIQNRRKSRVGHALENHIEAILKSHGVAFSKGPVTEGRSRPDFLFPSIEDYRDPSFPAEQLRMLGVKTTCKDRWRQILSEADRIERKHLLTLEPGLSTNQMTEMHARRVELVVPREIGKTLPAGTGITVLRVSDFVHLFPRE